MACDDTGQASAVAANRAGDDTVVGVLLAAGLGTRFAGGNKLLAPCGPEPGAEPAPEAPPVVRRAAEVLTGALTPAVAVLGHEADAVGQALADLPIERVENPDYERGQATSVARGVTWARDREADAAVFALGDMPWVRPGTYDALLAGFRESPHDIAVPVYEGQRGNPVVFGSRYFDDLAAVEGDTGGRVLVDREPVERVSVNDPGVRLDVDTESDLG